MVYYPRNVFFLLVTLSGATAVSTDFFEVFDLMLDYIYANATTTDREFGSVLHWMGADGAVNTFTVRKNAWIIYAGPYSFRVLYMLCYGIACALHD